MSSSQRVKHLDSCYTQKTILRKKKKKRSYSLRLLGEMLIRKTQQRGNHGQKNLGSEISLTHISIPKALRSPLKETF